MSQSTQENEWIIEFGVDTILHLLSFPLTCSTTLSIVPSWKKAGFLASITI